MNDVKREILKQMAAEMSPEQFEQYIRDRVDQGLDDPSEARIDALDPRGASGAFSDDASAEAYAMDEVDKLKQALRREALLKYKGISEEDYNMREFGKQLKELGANVE